MSPLVSSALCSGLPLWPSLPLLDNLLAQKNASRSRLHLSFLFPLSSPSTPPVYVGFHCIRIFLCPMVSCSVKWRNKGMPPCCGELIYTITTKGENHNARWQTSGEVFFPEYMLLVLSDKSWGMVVYIESTVFAIFANSLHKMLLSDKISQGP